MEHKIFFTELLSLCENDDSSLQKLPCYKSFSDLVPLRKSALRALAACHYIPECRDKIFSVLYNKALNNTNDDLVEAGYEAMKNFISGFKVDLQQVSTNTRQVLQSLQDYRNLNSNLIGRLCYMADLFPEVFGEKLCEQLLQLIKKWLEVAIVSFKQQQQQAQVAQGGARGAGGAAAALSQGGGQQQLRVAAGVVRFFQKIPPSHPPLKIIEMLCKLILTTERNLLIEPGSILREPLTGYLIKYPSETIDYFTLESCARDPQNRRCAEYVLKDEKKGRTFRAAVRSKPDKLIAMLGSSQPEVVFASLRYIWLSTKKQKKAESHSKDEDEAEDGGEWISEAKDVVDAVRKLWNDDAYHEKHKK